MSIHHGQFIWYELMTTDLPAAEAFYATVLGWDVQDAGMPGMRYSFGKTAQGTAAGLMALDATTSGAGAYPCWMGYVAVDDVDACTRHVLEAGGSQCVPPTDIPGVGRFSGVADPQGAAFMLFKGAPGDEPPAPPPGSAGHVGWHELMAQDGSSVFDFYAALFGWRKTQAMDMGEYGTYQLFAGPQGEADLGGMMTKPPQLPMALWRYYFNVPNIDAAVARLEPAGGQILLPPQQVPGGSWVVNCVDPQGAFFSLLAPAR